MENNLFRKGFALVIIVLFIGVSIIPLTGCKIVEKQTHVVTIDDNEPLDVRIIINGTEGKNGWFVSCVTITIIADDGGVLNIWYRLDGGYWKLYTMPFEVCEDGEHVIYAISFDPSGNQSNAQRDFKIDQTPPTTTHEFSGIMGGNGWYVSDVTVTLDAEDETSGVDYTTYKLDDGEWTTYTNPFVVTEDGEHILYYYSVDRAGNEEDVNEADFKIDRMPPPRIIIIIDGAMGENRWFISCVTITIEATSENIVYIMYRADKGDWTTYVGPFVFHGDGEHIIYAYGVDSYGNRYDAQAEFKIDKTIPIIDLLWDGENSKFVADVSDETSGVERVEFYLDNELGETDTEAPFEWEYPGIGRGHVVQAIVYDYAGNWCPSPPPPPIPRTRVFGIIRNPEFTEETVSLFAIVVVSNTCRPCILRQLTFQNSYSGYIGEHFIFAVFKYGPC